jgi:hypothetical protein
MDTAMRKTLMSGRLRSQTPYPGDQIAREALRAIGLSTDSWLGATVTSALRAPSQRLAELLDRFDQLVARSGLYEASHWALSHFIQGMEVRGAELVPTNGPLLIAANHPGMMDGLVITANLPRPDLKIVASALPVFTNLQAMKEHLIYCTRNTYERLNVVRSAIQHLRQDGAVLIFPRGILEPDPAVRDGAIESLERWSPSLEIMTRMVPQTAVVVAIVSGVLSSWSLKNPLTWLRRGGQERQNLAEVFQAVQHLLFPRSLKLNPRLQFSMPFTAGEVMDKLQRSSAMEAIRRTAQYLIADSSI